MTDSKQKRILHEDPEADLRLTTKPEEPERIRTRSALSRHPPAAEPKAVGSKIVVKEKEPSLKKPQIEEPKPVEPKTAPKESEEVVSGEEEDEEKYCFEVEQEWRKEAKDQLWAILDRCQTLGGDNFEAEQERVINELNKQKDTIKALLDDMKAGKAAAVTTVPAPTVPTKKRR